MYGEILFRISRNVNQYISADAEDAATFRRKFRLRDHGLSAITYLTKCFDFAEKANKIEDMSNVSNKEIGVRVREIRKELGLTQKNFGDLVGVKTVSVMSAYETGDTPIPLEILGSISEVSGRTINWIITGEKAITTQEEDGTQVDRDVARAEVREDEVKYSTVRKALKAAIEDELDKYSDIELSEYLTQLLKKGKENSQEGRD